MNKTELTNGILVLTTVPASKEKEQSKMSKYVTNNMTSLWQLCQNFPLYLKLQLYELPSLEAKQLRFLLKYSKIRFVAYWRQKLEHRVQIVPTIAMGSWFALIRSMGPYRK